MTKMTKAQLVDENIALRHNIALLEQHLSSKYSALRTMDRSFTRTPSAMVRAGTRCALATTRSCIVLRTEYRALRAHARFL